MTSSSSPSGPASVSPAGDALTVVVDDGNGSTRTWELTCSADGPGGDHPDAENACAAIAAARDPWAPVPADTACTMVYGGPQTATVTGTWGGVAVEARFARNDGCEIGRWDRLAPLLQPGTPVGTSRGAT